MLVGAPSSALKKTNQPREKGPTSDPTQPNSTQPNSFNRPIQLDDTKKQGLLTRGGGKARFGSWEAHHLTSSSRVAISRYNIAASSTPGRLPQGSQPVKAHVNTKQSIQQKETGTSIGSASTRKMFSYRNRCRKRTTESRTDRRGAEEKARPLFFEPPSTPNCLLAPAYLTDNRDNYRAERSLPNSTRNNQLQHVEDTIAASKTVPLLPLNSAWSKDKSAERRALRHLTNRGAILA